MVGHGGNGSAKDERTMELAAADLPRTARSGSA
jgi:hypothetical protein